MSLKSLFKKPKWLIAFILGVFLVGGWYFFSSRHHSSFQTIRPQSRTVVKTLELSGKVAADKIANLHFAVGGRLVYLPFQEGDQVKKFQMIASLDQRKLKKQLKKYLNLYAKTRNSFDQTRNDYQDRIDLGDIDLQLKRILENSQYDLNNSVIDVELQALAIEYAHLFSPIDGILVKSPVKTPNVEITPNDIFTVVDPNSLYFSAEVEESDLAFLKDNMHATITLDMSPDKTYPAHLTYLSFAPKSTQTTTVYEAKFAFDQTLPSLRLDLNGTAKLILEKRDHVLSLPLSTIYEDGGQSYVFVLDHRRKLKKKVELGLTGDEYVEIKSGLSPQDQVIVE